MSPFSSSLPELEHVRDVRSLHPSVHRSVAKEEEEEDDDDLIHAASLVLLDHERASSRIGWHDQRGGDRVSAGWVANCDIGSNH